MSESRDKIPWEFIAKRNSNTRSGAMHFMRWFRERVRNGKHIPEDFIPYAAELLGAAADAAEEPDSKKRATAIMKAMELSGRVDKGERDREISCAMLCLTGLMGMSHIEAKTHLSLELEELGVDAPEETLVSIFKRSREQVESGFYSLAAVYIDLDDDPYDHFCNYEFLSRHFPPL